MAQDSSLADLTLKAGQDSVKVLSETVGPLAHLV